MAEGNRKSRPFGSPYGRYDSPPQEALCPPGWIYADINSREGARIAADYWEEAGNLEAARWLRDWAELSPDVHEQFRRRKPRSVCGWGTNTKWAKTRRSRIERQACRQNPDIGHGYGLRGI